MEHNAKKLQIIEAAEELFASKGFAGTSVRDIAQQADINVSMISYYFGSKEKLIEALFDVRLNQSRSQIEMILQNEELTPHQKINIWIDSVLDQLMSSQSFHKIMMREQLSTERTPIISDHIMELKLRNVELMTNLISEGQKAGDFRENIDMMLITTTLYGTINQAIATQEFLRKIHHMEDMDDQEFQHFLKKKLSTHLKIIFKTIITNEIAD